MTQNSGVRAKKKKERKKKKKKKQEEKQLSKNVYKIYCREVIKGNLWKVYWK